MIKRFHLTTRVTEPVKREVRKIAQEEQRTVSQVVALLVQEALLARQSKAA